MAYNQFICMIFSYLSTQKRVYRRMFVALLPLKYNNYYLSYTSLNRDYTLASDAPLFSWGVHLFDQGKENFAPHEHPTAPHEYPTAPCEHPITPREHPTTPCEHPTTFLGFLSTILLIRSENTRVLTP